MGNSVITPSVIAKEALMQLENSMCMAPLVHKAYKNEFVKKGNTVSIRKPVKFTAVDGSTRQNQDVNESTTTISIDKQKHVSWQFSSQDLTLSIEEYSERYIKPACIALGNQVDYDLCGLFIDVANAVGTAGTAPSTFATLANAAKKLDEFAVPDDGNRCLVLDPAGAWAFMDTTLSGKYNPGMVADAIRKGKIGDVANMQVWKNQNINKFTGCADVASVTTNAASQTGSTLIVTGLTSAVAKGDVFTIDGLYAVNPVNRQSTGSLQQFVCTATTTATPTTLSIYPPIITSGAYQTVTGTQTATAAITFVNTASQVYTNNLAFHKNAFGLVMIPMELPDGAPFKARESYNNTSIRVIKDYDIDADVEIIRLDILYGIKTLYPELACRVLG